MMATRIYRWKGKLYTDETLHEAPKAFLKELERRGVEVPAAAVGEAESAASEDEDADGE